tara:strand:- start:833 stop:1096 length:264 start_codon:yes stop_codon:yes gene_type:complete
MKAKIGRPKLTEPYKPLQISVPERLHEQCKAVVKEFVKNHIVDVNEKISVSNQREMLITYELRECKLPVHKKYYDEAVRRVDAYLSN